jgi:TatD DNase family protein
MIDLHCHLDLYPKPAAVAQECARRGMYVLSVTTTPSAWLGTSALASGAKRIRTALGFHPQLAQERKGELTEIDRLINETRYVGEVGLDRTPECLPFWSDQVEVFEHILDACTAAGGRILTIHSRRAEDEVLARLEQRRQAGTPVLHWFSGSRRSLERASALGCWFSVGPSMLRGRKGRELVEQMPQDKVLTETDGPFAQYNDNALHPWDVADAVRQLAEIWSIGIRDTEEQLLMNLRTLVGSTLGEPRR